MSTSTMLLGRTFGLPRQMLKMRDAATQLEEEAGAKSGTVSAPSMYYFREMREGKMVDGLQLLKDFQNQWKSSLDHYARYPFAGGMKLLPAGLVETVMGHNESYMAQRKDLWDKWKAEEYPEWSKSGGDRMGSLYNPNDFPSIDDCAKRFICNVTVIPLSDKEQLERLTLISPKLSEIVKKSQDEAVELATRNAHGALWHEVLDKIRNIVKVLEKEKSKVHESLLGNVIAIADLIPSYNELHKDANLTALANEVKAKLETIDPDELRGNPEAKADALAKAKEICLAYEPYERAFGNTEE